MFMAWLMEQEDRDDEVTVLYKTLFRDYNNGCLPAMIKLKDILEHFMNKHPHKYVEVREQFVTAIKVYDKETKG